MSARRLLYQSIEKEQRFARWPSPEEVADDGRVVPDGHTLAWFVEDDDYRLRPANAEHRFCRQPHCNNTAVWQLARRVHLKGGRTTNRWWSYCGEHTYGRLIEDGRMLSLQMRRAFEPAEDEEDQR